MSSPTLVDRNALKTNQIFIIALLAIGFLLSSPWVVAIVCAIMLIGTIAPQAALFQRIHRDILVPNNITKKDLHNEDPAPHRFAQGMGGSVLLIATIALLAGASALGWGLTFLVIALAAVNVLFGFCAGCFVFFQLQRLRGV
jgi:general stress protein CsbA